MQWYFKASVETNLEREDEDSVNYSRDLSLIKSQMHIFFHFTAKYKVRMKSSL